MKDRKQLLRARQMLRHSFLYLLWRYGSEYETPALNILSGLEGGLWSAARTAGQPIRMNHSCIRCNVYRRLKELRGAQ